MYIYYYLIIIENLIMDRKKIAIHYLNSYFIYDILGILASIANPVFISGLSPSLRFFLYTSIFGKTMSLRNVMTRIS